MQLLVNFVKPYSKSSSMQLFNSNPSNRLIKAYLGCKESPFRHLNDTPLGVGSKAVIALYVTALGRFSLPESVYYRHLRKELQTIYILVMLYFHNSTFHKQKSHSLMT